ncbi:DUF6782 family putative metallopeptidase [Roseovarius aestuariivivens]|uniref:DUF6782 family putative metallopeptidase n=1 Tax=Roseovarius aestuariivivens TaxID=1888910 RepID=UPI001081A4D8|nr:DUF6782 family putative metallopeptidase [Roseovarius aestuariivivens]
MAPFEDQSVPAVASLVVQARKDVAGFPSLESALNDPALEICLSDKLILELGYMLVSPRRIVISSLAAPDLRRAIVVHELRHLDQVRSGACPRPGLSMEENARAVMANEADANAVSLLVAWEGRQDGKEALWDALKAWDSTKDIVARFEEAMTAGDGAAGAAAAAFAQWYASEARVERYYLSSCSDYLDREDQDHRLPSYGTLSDRYFRQLCILPGGAAYDCSDPSSR